MTTDIKTVWDTIVIGSGVGGLTAAAFLATNGQRVLVLEQHSVLGGNSHVFRRKKKWEFDVGIHYIGDCGPDGQVPRMFRALGLGDRVQFNSMDPTGYDTIVFPDLTVKIPYGWDNYLSNLIQAFPKEEKGLRKFVSIISTLGHAADRSTAPASNKGIAEMVLKAKTKAIWAMLPVDKLFDYCGLSPKARVTVAVQSGQYGCPPSRAPVIVHAGLLHNYIHGGAWYPKGGGQTFAGNLHNVLLAHGGRALTSASVARIIVENDKAVGVRLESGEEYRATSIVSNADLRKTYLDMIGAEHLPNGVVRKVKNYQMAAPFFNVYLGIQGELKDQMPNTNFFSMPTDADFSVFQDLIDKPERYSREHWIKDFKTYIPAFIHSGSMKDPTNPRHAPAGCSSLESMTMVPALQKLWTSSKDPAKYARDPQYLDIKAQLTEIMIDRTEAVLPGIKSRILWKEASTPLTQGRYTRSTESTAYGLEANYKQYGPFRPRAHTKVAGLFIAGSSTAWGPSIEGSMLSGMHAAAAVLKRDLDAEMRQGRIYGQPDNIPVLPENWDMLKATSNLNKKVRHTDIDQGHEEPVRLTQA